jgi:Flp pilus assembly pilin Flp
MTIANLFRDSDERSSFFCDDRGLSTVEYVIILVLIAAAAVGTWSLLGESLRGKLKSSIGQMYRVNID